MIKNILFYIFSIFILASSFFIRNSMSMEEQDYSNAEVSHFNVKTIIEKHIKDNPELLDSSKNKDIVAFLGKTGAGKSTLINFINDKILKVESGDIMLVNTQDPSVMKIGTSSSSETLLPKYISRDKILYYDFAGFSDTRGTGISLVNACFIKNIIENAASVRLVFVVSQDEIFSERGKSFKEISDIARTIVINEDIEDFSTLILTKTTLGKSNQEIIKTLQKKLDSSTCINNWLENGRFSKMSSENLLLEEKMEINRVILETNPRRLQNIKIDVIYKAEEKNEIKSLYKKEIDERIKNTINYNVKLQDLHLLDSTSLEFKRDYFRDKFLQDLKESCESSSLIQLIRPIAQEIYEKVYNDMEIIAILKKDEIIARLEGLIDKQKLRLLEEKQGDYRKIREKLSQYGIVPGVNKSCKLNGKIITNDELQLLVQDYKPKELYLKGCEINDNGIKILVQADWPQLCTLDLRNNNLSNESAQYLSNKKFINLKGLDLRNNKKITLNGYEKFYSTSNVQLILNEGLYLDNNKDSEKVLHFLKNVGYLYNKYEKDLKENNSLENLEGVTWKIHEIIRAEIEKYNNKYKSKITKGKQDHLEWKRLTQSKRDETGRASNYEIREASEYMQANVFSNLITERPKLLSAFFNNMKYCYVTDGYLSGHIGKWEWKYETVKEKGIGLSVGYSGNRNTPISLSVHETDTATRKYLSWSCSYICEQCKDKAVEEFKEEQLKIYQEKESSRQKLLDVIQHRSQEKLYGMSCALI